MRQLVRKSLFLGELTAEHRSDLVASVVPLYDEFVVETAQWWNQLWIASPASGQEVAHYFLEKPSFECLSSAHPPELVALQQMAKHYFQEAGLGYDFAHTDVTIRYWQITLSDQDDAEPSSQPVTSEDELNSGIAFTCMMVCRKDEGVQGGHLNVMPDHGKSLLSDLAGLYVTHQVPLSEGSVVVRRSDMPFQLSPCMGTGVMQWVNVTIGVDL